MNITEAILSFPGLDEISATAVQRVLAIRTVNGADEFSAQNSQQVNLCAADLYVELVNQPDFGEGSLSITHSRKHYLSTAARLYRENGETAKAINLSKSINVSGKSVNKW